VALVATLFQFAVGVGCAAARGLLSSHGRAA
jgi:hypothetical protein